MTGASTEKGYFPCVAVLAACFGLAKLVWREHAIFASANGYDQPTSGSPDDARHLREH